MSPADAGLVWIVPGQLAVRHYPSEGEYEAIAAAGMTLIVNLAVRAHDEKRLADHGLAQLYLPVADFTAPTQGQARRGVDAIHEAIDDGGRVLVHCDGGLGRTGTLVSCYLVSTGMSADDAIARVRELRPGSVETPAQVEAVREFARAVSP
jgi:atypical dual specificity phosphatase